MAGIALKQRKTLWRWLLYATLLLCLVPAATADSAERRMTSVGVRIFPSVLAASFKLNSQPQGSPLVIYVVYKDDADHARAVSERLAQMGPIKEHPLQPREIPASALSKLDGPAPFAILVSENVGRELPAVIDYSQKNDVLSFSPFSGDVEKGVLTGIIVSDRVLPYINLRTLAGMSFTFKPFFLKVAAAYAP